MRYETPEEFRQALEAELVRAAKEPSQVEQLRSEVTFERVLVRLDYTRWILKGGYAVRLLLPMSRATQDLDVGWREQSIKGLAPQKRALKIEQAVAAELSKDIGDHFRFEVRQALPIGDMEPENLAAIVLVNATVGGEEFCKIRVDVGVTDREALPGEHVAGRHLLAFAGLENPDIVTTAREEIFADKLLAYAGQGECGMRWRDLVDMQLLIEKGLDLKKLFMAMQAVERRGAHFYPSELPFPPGHWAKEYAETASKCQLPAGLDEAFARLKTFAHPVLEHFRDRQFNLTLDTARSR